MPDMSMAHFTNSHLSGPLNSTQFTDCCVLAVLREDTSCPRCGVAMYRCYECGALLKSYFAAECCAHHPWTGTMSMDLLTELLAQAERESAASKMIADAKTARQTDRDDYPELAGVGYDYLRPEQTVSARAATEIETLRAALVEARDQLASEDPSGLGKRLPLLAKIDALTNRGNP